MTGATEGPRDLAWVRENVVMLRLDHSIVEAVPDLIAAALRDTVCLRAEFQYDRQAFKYYLAARRFPKNRHGDRVPEWTIKIEAHDEPYDDVFGSGVRSVIDKIELVAMEP